MTRIALLIALAGLAGCGGQDKREPRPAASTPPAAPTNAAVRWPGTVAYSAEVGPATGLDLFVRAPGGEPRRLTDGAVNEFSPSWAPDGRWLAYRVNPPRGDEGDIWRMRRDGGGRRNLTRSPGVADWSPAVSPDGRWLAFGANRGGDFEIARIAVEGGKETNLTTHAGRDQWPAVSPDGKQIAFMSDRDGGEDVFVMRADGGGVRNVSRSAERFETHPTWAADGRLTCFQHSEGPVHVRVDPLDGTAGHTLPIDGAFVFDWTP
jgi:Tol biopolymer transport system component